MSVQSADVHATPEQNSGRSVEDQSTSPEPTSISSAQKQQSAKPEYQAVAVHITPYNAGHGRGDLGGGTAHILPQNSATPHILGGEFSTTPAQPLTSTQSIGARYEIAALARQGQTPETARLRRVDADIMATPSTACADLPEGQPLAKVITVKDWVNGILFMLASAILFSFNGVFVVWGSHLGYSSMELFVFRAGMQELVTIGAFFFQRAPDSTFGFRITWQEFKILLFLKERPEMIKWVLMRGIWAGLAGSCYFHAMTVIPLGDAITVFSIYPVSAAFVAWIVLGEKISMVHIVSLLFAIGGVFMIAQGSTSASSDDDGKHYSIKTWDGWTHEYIGYALSVVGAVLAGSVFVIIRLAQDTPVKILVMSHGVFCLIIAAAVGLSVQKFIALKAAWHLLILFGFGMIGFFGQYTQNLSTQLIPAGVASLVRSSDSIFSYLWEIFFFNTTPAWLTIGGAACVLMGVVLVSIEKLKKALFAEKTALHERSLRTGNYTEDTTELSRTKPLLEDPPMPHRKGTY